LEVFRWLERREESLSTLPSIAPTNPCSAGCNDPNGAEGVFMRAPPHEARASGYMAVSPSLFPEESRASGSLAPNPLHWAHTGGPLSPLDDLRQTSLPPQAGPKLPTPDFPEVPEDKQRSRPTRIECLDQYTTDKDPLSRGAWSLLSSTSSSDGDTDGERGISPTEERPSTPPLILAPPRVVQDLTEDPIPQRAGRNRRKPFLQGAPARIRGLWNRPQTVLDTAPTATTVPVLAPIPEQTKESFPFDPYEEELNTKGQETKVDSPPDSAKGAWKGKSEIRILSWNSAGLVVVE
jgi:hypothetical protein